MYLSSKFGNDTIFRKYSKTNYFIKNDKNILFDHTFVSIRIKKLFCIIDIREFTKNFFPIIANKKFKLYDHNNFYDPIIPKLNNLIINGCVKHFIADDVGRYFIVRTDSKYCVYKHGYHKKNHIYLLIDTIFKKVYVRCYDELCSKLSYSYHLFEEQFSKSFNECYINYQLFNLVQNI